VKLFFACVVVVVAGKKKKTFFVVCLGRLDFFETELVDRKE
jgi:hypothetical protein